MSNKEGGNYRRHFLAIRHEEKKRWIQNYEEDEKKPGFYKIIRRKGEFMDNIQNETFYNKVIELFQNAKKKFVYCSKYNNGIFLL